MNKIKHQRRIIIFFILICVVVILHIYAPKKSPPGSSASKGGNGLDSNNKNNEVVNHKENRFMEDTMQYFQNLINYAEQSNKIRINLEENATNYISTSYDNNRKLLILDSSNERLKNDLLNMQRILDTKVNNVYESMDLQKATTLKHPILAVPKERWKKFNNTWMGYSTPLLTMSIIGRLGNIMATYATLIGIYYAYDVPVFMMEEVQVELHPVFPHLTMYTLPVRYTGGSWLHVGAKLDSKADYSGIEETAAGLRGPRRAVVEEYPCEMQIFNAYREEIMKEFKFSSRLIKLANDYLRNIAKQKQIISPVYIGIHIRRTDYTKTMQKIYKSQLPNKNYIYRAITFFKKKVNLPIFIISSDDKDEVRDMFENEDFFVTDDFNEPSEDLAILSSCNHTIMTVGSYGFWAGYLAGGTVIYPDLKFNNSGYYFTQPYFNKAGLKQFVPMPAY